jgi:hypothetical protein
MCERGSNGRVVRREDLRNDAVKIPADPGRWDALGPAAEQVKDEDDTSGIKEEDQDESEGRVWRVQAHARNSITAMKVDPVNGSGVSGRCRVYLYL